MPGWGARGKGRSRICVVPEASTITSFSTSGQVERCDECSRRRTWAQVNQSTGDCGGAGHFRTRDGLTDDEGAVCGLRPPKKRQTHRDALSRVTTVSTGRERKLVHQTHQIDIGAEPRPPC